MNPTCFRPILLSASAILALAAPPQLYAQAKSTPAAPAAASTGEEVVQLNPFEVESARDYGYRATNSSTATGSGAAVRDTPMSIAILTEDYLRDKNILDVQEAIRNISSLTAEGKEENVVTSRGFQSVLKQDGAEIEGLYDTSNVGRIEVIKGAVSILQGRASAGGVVNVISRRPKFAPETRVRTMAGSYGLLSTSLMHTAPVLGDRVAYLVGFAKTDRPDGWADWTYRNESSLQAAMTLRLSRNLSVTFDYQRTERSENNTQHISFTHPAFLAADLEAIRLYDLVGRARPTSYPRIGETTRAWLNRTPGFGTAVPAETIDVMEAMYPGGYRANIQGPEQIRENNYDTFSAEVLARVTPWLDLKSTASRRLQDRENLAWSTFRIAGGLTMNTRFSRSNFRGIRQSMRHEAISRFEILRARHRLLAGFEYQSGISQTRTLQGPPAAPYNPRTGGVRYLAREVAAFSPNGYPGLRLTNSTTPTRSFYAVEQLEAWENRINVLVGGRHSADRRGTVEASRFTPQYGAVVRIPRFEDVSVYVSHGESYRPNFNRDGLGNPIPPIEEVNQEAGVKVELFDGKVSGSAAIYRLEQKNVSLRDYAREAALGITGLYILSGLARSEGWETDLVVSPMRNFQFTLSYSEIWEAKTVRAEDVRQQGVRMQGAPDSQFSIWSKYTFLRGPLQRVYVGAGTRYTGTTRIHPSWESPIDAKPYWYTDFTAGWPLRFGRVQAELVANVKNVFDKFYFNQTFRPADPRQFFVSANVKF